MPGKINASLNNIKWGDKKISDLFKKENINNLKYKTGDLPSEPIGDFVLPALTAGIENQGLNNYVPKKGATILKNAITISANGANTGITFYQNKEFTVLQDSYALKWIYNNDKLTDNMYLFFVSCIRKAIYGVYEWTNKAGWERIKDVVIKVPLNLNNEIDFQFMDDFITEIKSIKSTAFKKYLKHLDLGSCNLSQKEEDALFNYPQIEWGTFNLFDLFGKSSRGKRLRSADRIPGDLPFITAGEANEGFSDFIGNRVEVFEKNTTTIDMFGSAKYRNYKYGADDHVAVVHTEKLDKHAAIFVTSAIHKSSHTGQFDYSNNFYASDADKLNIKLPIKDNKPDYEKMALIAKAVEKILVRKIMNYTS